jgi:hypothetical protein
MMIQFDELSLIFAFLQISGLLGSIGRHSRPSAWYQHLLLPSLCLSDGRFVFPNFSGRESRRSFGQNDSNSCKESQSGGGLLQPKNVRCKIARSKLIDKSTFTNQEDQPPHQAGGRYHAMDLFRQIMHLIRFKKWLGKCRKEIGNGCSQIVRQSVV